jgi:16S rRNA processing protein RimM
MILLGKITAAHGIRGDVVVRTFTGDPAAIAGYGPLTDAQGGQPLRLTAVRVTDKGLVARIEGVKDRNGAEALKGRDLYVPRERLPEPEQGAYYHEDLIGLSAMTPAGQAIGRIVAVLNYGAGDILELQLTGQSRTELVPFTDAFVPTVDVGAGRVTVVLPATTEVDQDSGD